MTSFRIGEKPAEHGVIGSRLIPYATSEAEACSAECALVSGHDCPCYPLANLFEEKRTQLLRMRGRADEKGSSRT